VTLFEELVPDSGRAGCRGIGSFCQVEGNFLFGDVRKGSRCVDWRVVWVYGGDGEGDSGEEAFRKDCMDVGSGCG